MQTKCGERSVSQDWPQVADDVGLGEVAALAAFSKTNAAAAVEQSRSDPPPAPHRRLTAITGDTARMARLRVLVVEDEPTLARLVARALNEDGHDVRVAHDGQLGLESAIAEPADVVVLDLMLPRLDGIAVCRELRRLASPSSILMLTARDAVADRVRGLDAGADDYLVKPFALDELLARVRALGRRTGGGGTLRVDDLIVDTDRRTVTRAGAEIQLSPTEFRLLEHLARNAGLVVAKQRLLERVWGDESDATENAVETYIHYLRAKMDRPPARPLIHTVRGAGYVLRS